jgi:hypothetical protein
MLLDMRLGYRPVTALAADHIECLMRELQIRRIDDDTIEYQPRHPVEQPGPDPEWDRALKRFLGIPTGGEDHA